MWLEWGCLQPKFPLLVLLLSLSTLWKRPGPLGFICTSRPQLGWNVRERELRIVIRVWEWSTEYHVWCQHCVDIPQALWLSFCGSTWPKEGAGEAVALELYLPPWPTYVLGPWWIATCCPHLSTGVLGVPLELISIDRLGRKAADMWSPSALQWEKVYPFGSKKKLNFRQDLSSLKECVVNTEISDIVKKLGTDKRNTVGMKKWISKQAEAVAPLLAAAPSSPETWNAALITPSCVLIASCICMSSYAALRCIVCVSNCFILAVSFYDFPFGSIWWMEICSDFYFLLQLLYFELMQEVNCMKLLWFIFYCYC